MPSLLVWRQVEGCYKIFHMIESTPGEPITQVEARQVRQVHADQRQQSPGFVFTRFRQKLPDDQQAKRSYQKAREVRPGYVEAYPSVPLCQKDHRTGQEHQNTYPEMNRAGQAWGLESRRLIGRAAASSGPA
jgi:hypothetical protein